MFQYAIGKALAIELDTTFKLDLEFLLDRSPRQNFVYRDYDLDIFNLTAEYATKGEIRPFFYVPKNRIYGLFTGLKRLITPFTVYREQYFHFDPKVFTLTGNIYLDGYWQTSKYFEKISQQIKNDFSFRVPIESVSDSLKESIWDSNSVCINVRRADFLTNSFHGICDMRYFEPAIRMVSSRIEDPHFFVFSDDPEWCLNNFKLPFKFTFVGHEHAGKKFATYLQLMSMCRHFIIPNSSFAWWAVWLNQNTAKIVVAPNIWFTDPQWNSCDLIPDNWARIEN